MFNIYLTVDSTRFEVTVIIFSNSVYTQRFLTEINLEATIVCIWL